MINRYSAIIPVLNEEKNILSCINQLQFLLPGLEIPVIDGGSTDNTVKLLAAQQVRVFSSIKNRGGGPMPSWRNKCTRKNYLFVHVDMTFPTNTFEMLEKYLNKDFQILFLNNSKMNQSYSSLHQKNLPTKNPPFLVNRLNIIQTSSQACQIHIQLL